MDLVSKALRNNVKQALWSSRSEAELKDSIQIGTAYLLENKTMGRVLSL